MLFGHRRLGFFYLARSACKASLRRASTVSPCKILAARTPLALLGCLGSLRATFSATCHLSSHLSATIHDFLSCHDRNRSSCRRRTPCSLWPKRDSLLLSRRRHDLRNLQRYVQLFVLFALLPHQNTSICAFGSAPISFASADRALPAGRPHKIFDVDRCSSIFIRIEPR
jgi:hypothetical protein